MQNVGAIANIYEEQRYSSIEMIKSFRGYNPDSSIVLFCDGYVSDIESICKKYKCDCVIFSNKLGYPSSLDTFKPIEYFYRFLYCSNLIKEKFYINLEPDCLVTSNLELEDDCNSFIIMNCSPDWLYFFYDDSNRRDVLMNSMFDLYKLCGVYHDDIFDVLIGGGGSIYNKKFFNKILEDRDVYESRALLIKNIYDKHLHSNPNKNYWVFDYLLSLQIPFYLNKNFKYKTDQNILGKCDVNKHIIHPYKNFYI